MGAIVTWGRQRVGLSNGFQTPCNLKMELRRHLCTMENRHGNANLSYRTSKVSIDANLVITHMQSYLVGIKRRDGYRRYGTRLVSGLSGTLLT